MSFQAKGLPSGGLVVTRLDGEEIVIEQNGRIVAVVQVASSAPGRTRVRIRAPAGVDIVRAEIYGPTKRPAVPA